MTMRRLFFDIETSPCVGYFWRPGRNYIPPTNIITDSSIICIAWKWEHEDDVQVRCSDCKRQWRMSEVAYFASVGRQAKDEGWAK